jgi:hypothetical protein
LLVNVASNDGLQTSQTSKFVYNLWQPITAIQRADEDFNDATTPDAAWTPLLQLRRIHRIPATRLASEQARRGC